MAGVSRALGVVHKGVHPGAHPVGQGHVHDDGLDEHLSQQVVHVADDLVDLDHVFLVGEHDERVGAVVGDDAGVLQNLDVAAGGDIQILENARIIPDYRSNSLIVFANEEDMVKIDEIVGHVDNLLAQVLIEAIIVNVTLTDGMSTGMNAFMHNAEGPGDTRHIGGFMNGGPSTAGAAPATPPPPTLGVEIRVAREAKEVLPMLVMSSPLPGVSLTHSVPVP